MSVPLPSNREEIDSALREDCEVRILNAKGLGNVNIEFQEAFLRAARDLNLHASNIVKSKTLTVDDMKKYRALLRNYNDRRREFREHEHYAHEELNHLGKDFRAYLKPHR